VYLRDPFLRLSLVCQRPAAQDHTTRHPEWKALVRGQADESFGALLGRTPLAAELMSHHGTTHGMSQAIGGCHWLRQRHCLVARPSLRLMLPSGSQFPDAC
jgi:hypothetical protein